MKSNIREVLKETSVLKHIKYVYNGIFLLRHSVANLSVFYYSSEKLAVNCHMDIRVDIQ